QAGLNDENPSVRISCCRALGKRADPTSVEPLSGALKQDKDVDVRMAAAEALGKINSPEAIKALGVALDDRDPALQYAGVQSLKAITGKDYGPNVQAWKQMVAGENPPPYTPSVAERLQKLKPF